MPLKKILIEKRELSKHHDYHCIDQRGNFRPQGPNGIVYHRYQQVDRKWEEGTLVWGLFASWLEKVFGQNCFREFFCPFQWHLRERDHHYSTNSWIFGLKLRKQSINHHNCWMKLKRVSSEVLGSSSASSKLLCGIHARLVPPKLWGHHTIHKVLLLPQNLLQLFSHIISKCLGNQFHRRRSRSTSWRLPFLRASLTVRWSR